jgi:metal-responsive CopG/Arc/MetJ family transcriptional regulator
MMNTDSKKYKAYVSIRMPKDFVAKLDLLAEQNGRNRSQEIVFAIKKYLESSETLKNLESSHKTEYSVRMSPKVSSDVKEELLSLLYDNEIKDKIKKISNE